MIQKIRYPSGESQPVKPQIFPTGKSDHGAIILFRPSQARNEILSHPPMQVWCEVMTKLAIEATPQIRALFMWDCILPHTIQPLNDC